MSWFESNAFIARIGVANLAVALACLTLQIANFRLARRNLRNAETTLARLRDPRR